MSFSARFSLLLFSSPSVLYSIISLECRYFKGQQESLYKQACRRSGFSLSFCVNPLIPPCSLLEPLASLYIPSRNLLTAFRLKWNKPLIPEVLLHSSPNNEADGNSNHPPEGGMQQPDAIFHGSLLFNF